MKTERTNQSQTANSDETGETVEPVEPVEKKQRDVGARLGAIVGAVTFLFVGALPALLFGGYAGLMMGQALFGNAESLAVRIVTGGGMVLGLAAVLSLFLVLGAALGSFVGHVAEGRNVEAPKSAAKPEES